jgi:hypothetical protein
MELSAYAVHDDAASACASRPRRPHLWPAEEMVNEKRQRHARESGNPDLAARAGALVSRSRGNDTGLKDHVLRAPHSLRRAPTRIVAAAISSSAAEMINAA